MPYFLTTFPCVLRRLRLRSRSKSCVQIASGDKNESQNINIKSVVNHLLLLRRTQTGNALLLRSALRREFSISCLFPGFSLSLILEGLGKVFTRFLYLAFSLRADVDFFESVNKAKDGGYEGRGDVDMGCWGYSQRKNNVLCSVCGNDARADTGLVGDLRGVIN